jgi:hypothetical protein
MARSTAPAPWGVLLALAAALAACRAREGERCVCAEDCREGLACVASGRVLASGECSPAVGDNASPGVCLPEEDAGNGGGAGGGAEPYWDSKLDFEPGLPPAPETDETAGTSDETAGTTETTAGTTETTAGTTETTAGTTEASTGGTTTGSSGGTTDASTSAGT